MVTIRKTAIVLLCLVFFTGLGTVIFLELYYASHLPQAPEVRVGRVHQVTVNHGFVVYATSAQLHLLRAARRCLPIACLCGLIAGLLNFKYGDFPPWRSP